MSGAQRVYKQKIRATATLEKVFRAMELIAASRITSARNAALGTDPYTRALTDSIGTVVQNAIDHDHPLLNERTDTNRVAVLVVTSDRGMAGSYSSSVLKAAEKLIADLKEEGKEPLLYVAGRRGASYFHFHGIDVEKSWIGDSDHPNKKVSAEIAQTLLDAFLAPADAGGVAQLHVVFTRFVSMVKQVVQVRQMLPVQVVEEDDPFFAPASEDGEHVDHPESAKPIFDFEPSATQLFDVLLPMYMSQRIQSTLLMAAASELASRQAAMHAATDNAHNLIQDYTRLANNARQAEITTEITEIVSGANALQGDAR
ncbi:MAG: F0F1 ATP synthase subunit gamma [Actinomycetaceae bacterium]|nr:F0F1 ATP synthase subunit gamma [Actinomycetaceae bacterium]MDY6082769.1 F0F1 ATP synthase subunit gamma [Actinomycetaceae bacterium]